MIPNWWSEDWGRDFKMKLVRYLKGECTKGRVIRKHSRIVFTCPQ